MGINFFDTVQAHGFGASETMLGVAMNEFVKKGNIRYDGVSNVDARDMERFEATRKIDAVQPSYRLFKFTPQTVFRADDWRSKSPLFQGETLRLPVVDVAIVGARTAGQIDQTAPAADINLGLPELAEIDHIVNGAVPVGGPAPETV